MIFQLFKWHFDVNWYKFEKRWADVFQIYPNAIHFNPPQFCPSLSLLSFPVFCLSSSIVLSRYFVISVNSMTSWSMLKLPKIAWPSPFEDKSKAEKRPWVKKKKNAILTALNTMLFPGKIDLSSQTLGGLVVPLVCGFVRCNNLQAWQELFTNLFKRKSLWFWEETFSLSEFTGYADSTDFREILPEHSRDNDKPKCAWQFWYLTYFSRGVHLRNTSRTFFATANLDVGIWTTNQNIEKAYTL